jgi:hypothetical protein
MAVLVIRWQSSASRHVLVAAIALLLLGGCGQRTGPAVVEGTVTLDGKPVANAFIVFVSSDGRATLPALIRSDGSFRVERAPVGQVKVSIDGVPDAGLPLEMPPPASRPNEDPELALIRKGLAVSARVPPRFKNPEQSGVFLELGPGLNLGCRIDLQGSR